MEPTILRLGNKDRRINEPVFKRLRKIVKAYNTLATENDPAVRIRAADTVLKELTEDQLGLSQVSSGELVAAMEKLPAICGLESIPTASTNPGKPRETDWGYLYGHLSSCFGWTYDYIDNHMTISRLNELRGYLLKHPPTHQLVAAYMGYEYRDQQSGSAFLRGLLARAKQQGALN